MVPKELDPDGIFAIEARQLDSCKPEREWPSPGFVEAIDVKVGIVK